MTGLGMCGTGNLSALPSAMYLLKSIFGTRNSNNKPQGPDTVTGRSKLVRRFGKRGKGKGQFNMPCGVATTKSGDIVVTDTENHRIQIFTPEGLYRCQFGSRGSEPHRLNYPMCVAVNGDDHVLVTDSVNACVKIFTLNGDYLKQIGENRIFEFPYGICISRDEALIVSDIIKHNITVFKPSGDVSHSFGSYGNSPLEFDHPYFLAVNKDKQIIVNDSGNGCIKIFHFEGRLLRCFTWCDFKLIDGQFASLSGLCADPDGNTILICNSTVYILAKDGRLWDILTPTDGLTAPKCVAFSNCGHLIVTQSGFREPHDVCVFIYKREDYESLNTILFYAISV